MPTLTDVKGLTASFRASANTVIARNTADNENQQGIIASADLIDSILDSTFVPQFTDIENLTTELATANTTIGANATLIAALQASITQLIALITPLDMANTYVANSDGTVSVTPVVVPTP